MPRPPLLPDPNRQAIFENGKTWDDWINTPDEPVHAERMRELHESITLDTAAVERLGKLERTVNVIAIAESWCGDVIRQVPLLIKMIEATNGKARVRFIMREDNPDYFARFLTNGGEAIPKFVFCNDAFTEVGNYGPMPSTPRKYISMGKAVGDIGAARRLVGQFDERDGNTESVAELLGLIELAALPELPSEG
jgi:hypothetical protein